MTAELAEKLKLGIWTAMYWEYSPENVVRHVARLGWKYIDLAAEHLCEVALGERPRMKRFAELLSGLGVTAWQTHSALDLNVAHDDADVRAEHLRVLRTQITQSADLGARCVVVHPGTCRDEISGDNYAPTLALNVEAFGAAAAAAQMAGIDVAIENMGRNSFGGRVEQLRELIDAVGSPRLRICLDTGHANAAGLDVPGAVRDIGPLLACTHLNDNDGTGDQHRTPGGGSIDWFAVMRALGDIEYAGARCFEIPGEGRSPIAIRDAKLDALARMIDFASDPANASRATPVRTEDRADFMRRGWTRPDAFDV